MYSMVVAQHYYEKDEENKFAGFKGISEVASAYTIKVYDQLNDLLKICKINKDLNKENIFIISEVILEFKSIKEELNPEEPIYLNLEEFSEKEDLYTSLSNINCSFSSEIDPKDISNEMKQIIDILVTSFRKDVVNFLNKEKNLNVSIK